ncbi:S28 family serine protease [Corallococcus macrosporus]|uniref:Multidrug transporter n=1 Tax=Corallococcus macrosporus DSM 14697 TaxID=1189310 RepID=A0A250JTC9_9BACT|nr:S28 family serine protease [Corallococcus macrosporus]ATB46621.1 multidrug transporter [Corallococcus macrosporus DSM 14697]
MPHSRRLSRFISCLLPLLLVLTQTACGDDTPEPSRDAGVQALDAGNDAGLPPADAGTDDAGTEPVDAGTDDAGSDDAGTEPEDAGTEPEDAGTEPEDAGTHEEDGGTEPVDAGSGDGGTEPPECPFGPPDAGVSNPGDPTVVQDPNADILDRLRAVPGLTVDENPYGSTVPAGHRFFVMEYDQPADHARPECQRFKQRMTLLHHSTTAPVVFHTSGYQVSLSTGRRELTTLLAANQLSIEHRFFDKSRPAPADWSQLTIQQSADDFHRAVQALKPIYAQRWVSTGVSKGGETMVFYRRFHPEDVDATVAYVAPLVRGEDERFPAFQEAVGGVEQAACRETIHTFQRAVLNRREEMVALLRAHAEANGLTYNQLGFERALEHAVIETYFAFWQYSIPDYCYAFEVEGATSDHLLDVIDWVVGLATFSDSGPYGIEPYYPYYYQASLELGWPKPYEAHLGSLIQHPGTNIAPVYSTPGVPVVFRPQAMQDIEDWLVAHGERVMFIYGDLDPWTAAAFPLGNAQDSFVFTVPGGNHGSNINQLPSATRAQAQDIVRRWANVASLKHAPVPPPEADQLEFGPHLRPLTPPPTAP